MVKTTGMVLHILVFLSLVASPLQSANYHDANKHVLNPQEYSNFFANQIGSFFQDTVSMNSMTIITG